jgi:hypothetical protein
MSEIARFWWHYLFTVFSGVFGILFIVLGVVDVAERFLEGESPLIPVKLRVILLTLTIFIAQASAYQDLADSEPKVGAYLVVTRQPFSPPDRPALFPVGQPATLYLSWRNLNAVPATNPLPLGQMFLRQDAQESTQQELISIYKDQVAGAIKKIPAGTTLAPILQNGPNTSFTVRGPIIMHKDVDLISAGKEVVFVLATVRFRDTLGEHEAHECSYFAGFQHYGNVDNIIWQSCFDYNTPIDIH